MDPNSINWAARPVLSSGVIVNYMVFEIKNRDTNRVRQLHLPCGGISAGVSAGGGLAEFANFTTSIPVNFYNLNGIGARVSSANIGVFWGYSIVILTLWESSSYFSRQIAQVDMRSTGPMLPGGGCAHGVTIIN